MRRRVLALLAAAALAAGALSTGACKKTRVTCTDPPEKRRESFELDEDLKRMAEAATLDPKLCDELASPRITLANDELLLSGPKERHLARRADLPADEIRGVERLRENLRSYNMQLHLVRPEHTRKKVEFRLDPSLETARAASIILSAAYAEYDDGTVTTGSMTFPLLSYRRSPPDVRYIWSMLHVVASSESSVTVHVSGPVCAKTAPVTVANRELGTLVARLCAENKRTYDSKTDVSGEGPGRNITTCFDSVEVRALPRAPFVETAGLLRAVVTSLADQKPTIDVALLVVGSEPRMKGVARSISGISLYVPGVEGSAYCVLPDGGLDKDYSFVDAGGLVYD
jgi:hypothetical protein